MNPNGTTRQEIDRPDPDDIVFGELNIERWPALWNTSDSRKVRRLSREVAYPDGSKMSAELTVEPSTSAGDLTTETLKVFSVLLAIRQEQSRAKGKETLRLQTPITLRNIVRRLNPGKHQAESWGGRQRNSVKRHLRKLMGVNLFFQGSFWDATAEKRRRFEGGFSLISDYFIAEERRFKNSTTEQLPLELGYFRLNEFLVDNLLSGLHAPFYLSQRLRIRSPFALLLYNHLDLKMSHRPKYQRDIEALFTEDFPHVGVKYPAPSQRLRLLERAIKELKGRAVTSGVFENLSVNTAQRGSGRKLVVTKAPFPVRLVRPEPKEETVDTGVLDERAPTEADLRRELLIQDIIEVTRDEGSRDFYRLVARHLDEQMIFRLLSEIKAEEAGDFRGSRGKLFFVKVRDLCREQDIAPFWNSSKA